MDENEAKERIVNAAMNRHMHWFYGPKGRWWGKHANAHDDSLEAACTALLTLRSIRSEGRGK
jgi:hypothetical protein